MNPTQPLVVPLFASQKLTATTTSGVTNIGLNNACLLQLDATAQSGTNPTLDVVVYDAPTKDGPWSTLFTFTQITAATGNQLGVPTRAPQPFIKATATLGGTATPTETFSLYITAYQSAAIQLTFASSALVITGTGASAFAVGPNGATNPTLQVDPSTASAATGLKIKSAAAAAGLALSVISSGTNENLTIDAKGSGTVTIGSVSTGNIIAGANLQITDAKNIVLATGTGTKIGTATTQKLGFYNVTPVVQPAASADVTGFVAGAGTASKSDSTWTGASGASAYTVGGIVTALKALGLLAA